MTDQEKIDRLIMIADSAIFWLGQCVSDVWLAQKHEELEAKLKEITNEQ